MPDIKWWRSSQNQCWCALRFVVLSYSRNRYSKALLVYDCDTGGLLVVLVIHCCVNIMEAKMETARWWTKMGMKFMRVGCEKTG